MGAVEDIKEEDLKGEAEFVVELDRKTPQHIALIVKLKWRLLQ